MQINTWSFSLTLTFSALLQSTMTVQAKLRSSTIRFLVSTWQDLPNFQLELAQETSILVLQGSTTESMLLVMFEPMLPQAILCGITFMWQPVLASGLTHLPLFHNCSKSLMLTGIHHMLFQLKLFNCHANSR